MYKNALLFDGSRISARIQADIIFSGPRKNRKFFRKKKEKSVKFCTKMPLVPIGQEFRSKSNFSILA